MSSRCFRKVVGKPTLPEAPDDSDEEYQPLYVKNPGKSKYAGLVVSSQSESDCGSPEVSEEEEQYKAAAALPKSVNSKKKKKKGKGKNRKASKEADLDEIERSVKEVNALLGAPLPAPVKPEKVNQALTVLTLEPKHLNVASELRRLFGPEDDQARRVRPQQNRALMLRRVLVHPNKDTPVYEFNNTGLSMAKYKDVNQRMYFVYSHDTTYQRMHREFLGKFANAQGNSIVMYLDSARRNMHVEALLEISDRLFRLEENSVANEIVENVVTYLQYVAHPSFILSQTNIRLDYKFMENRPFHVAMLKYAYLLSNKACHRTALEIAKMMLLVDPNDPLALLSLIDILALRAREHEWLIETIKYFDRQRDAGLLYNIKYSNGLAHFHVALKNKQDFGEADRIIQEAILAHPQVFVKILEFCSISDPVLLGHAVFKQDPKQLWSPGVEELFMIYAKMTWPRWNEPAVITWFIRNAKELCASFNDDPKVQEAAENWARTRHGLFQVWPPEYLRHISILSSMAKLILDVPLTSFYRPTCGWDPVFDKSVNRYNYTYHVDHPRNVGATRSPVYSNDIRNDYLIMLSQISAHPHLLPLTSLSEADAAFMIPAIAERFGNSSMRTMVQPVPPAYNMDLVFNDNDSDFTTYDYDDDDENFELYERDLAEALEAVGVDGEDDDDDDDPEEAMQAASAPANRGYLTELNNLLNRKN